MATEGTTTDVADGLGVVAAGSATSPVTSGTSVSGVTSGAVFDTDGKADGVTDEDGPWVVATGVGVWIAAKLLGVVVVDIVGTPVLEKDAVGGWLLPMLGVSKAVTDLLALAVGVLDGMRLMFVLVEAVGEGVVLLVTPGNDMEGVIEDEAVEVGEALALSSTSAVTCGISASIENSGRDSVGDGKAVGITLDVGPS